MELVGLLNEADASLWVQDCGQVGLEPTLTPRG